MDTVGNPIFFHQGQSAKVMQSAALELMSEALDDRKLAEVVMDRLSGLMRLAAAECRPPVIARTVWLSGDHVFEVAIFNSPNGAPDVFRLSIPEVITTEVSLEMVGILKTAVSLSGGVTDVGVCQILCGATADPWSIIEGE